MRILNVCASLDPVMGGGTGERTFQMSRYLIKAGMESTILTMDLGLNDERRSDLKGARVIALPCLIKRFYVPRFTFRQIRGIVEECDLVHLMNHWSIINAIVYFAATRLKKPYVVCPAGALPIYGRSKVVKTLYNWFVGRRIIRNANGCIAITDDEVSQFERYGVPSGKVVVIPNGIDIGLYLEKDTAAIRKKFGLVGRRFILFMGRLNVIKGPDLLANAFANLKNDLPDYHLVFAGNDEGLLPLIQEIAVKHKMEDRFHFVGFLTGAEKSQLLHAAELLVIPSRQEAMSIVVLEAGIVGCPVLASDQCGIGFVTEIQGGQLVPASVACLQAGLQDMLGRPDQLQSMGENLRKYVEQRFLWGAVLEKYIELYRHILGEVPMLFGTEILK